MDYRILNSLGRFIKVHKNTNHLLSNNNMIYKISCRLQRLIGWLNQETVENKNKRS